MPVLAGTGDSVQQVFDLTRAMLNDRFVYPVLAELTEGVSQGGVWPDIVLAPFVQHTYRDLQKKLATNGVSRRVEVDEIQIPLTCTKINDDGAAPDAPLPADFIYPLKLWERTDGTTDPYVEMAEAGFGLPQRENLTSTLDFWEYRGNEILLLGATGARQIKMRFEKSLPVLTQAGDKIGIREAVGALAYGAAALAARSRGVSTLARDMSAQYEESAAQIVNGAVRPNQRRPIRRRGYGGVGAGGSRVGGSSGGFGGGGFGN